MAERSEKSDGKDASKLLGKYLAMFTESWEYAQQNYHTIWENNWKLYRNIRTQHDYPSTVETFVPMVNSTVNTIVASLFSTVPTVRYIPNYTDQEADTKVLNEIYQDFARRDGWNLKNKINGRQGVITGNYCAYYEWTPSKDGGYVHKVIVPVRDMIIDPQATSSEDWRYVGRRFFATKKQLKAEKIYDFETGKMVPRYKNLNDVKPGGGIGGVDSESDKNVKDQALGTTAPGASDQIELIEIWTRERVAVIANRSVLIEEKENPHYALEKSKFEQRKTEHELERIVKLQTTGEDIGEFKEEFDTKHAGLLPFAHGSEYKDVSLIYGSSDVDIIADSQELLNTLTDLNIESVLYTLYPEKTIDPKYASSIDDLSPAPGKVYPLPSGAVQWNNPPVIPQNAFNERANIKTEIREAASVSEISKGITATDSTTATEIKAMLAQADIRIQEKAQNLADGFYFDEAKICLKLLQLYAGDTYYLRNISDAGVSFDEIDMTKFLGEYTPMVTLDIQKKLADAERQDAYSRAYQIIIQDPTNNIEAAKEIMYPKMMPELTQEEIERIITPPAPAMPNPPVGAPDGAGEVLPSEMVEAPTMAEQALGAQAVAPNEEVI